MDSFRLWQIAQSDLPSFIRQLHDRLEPRRTARALSFWHKQEPHVLDQHSPSIIIHNPSTSAKKQAKRIELAELSMQEKLSMLQKIGGLENLSAFSLNALASNSTFRCMKTGETLFKEGGAIQEAVLLLEGQCLLTKRAKNGLGSIQIACLGNGELCTESIISGVELSGRLNIQTLRHEHTAIMTAPSIVIAIDREHFRSGLKFETIKQLKSHIEIKRMVRGQIEDRPGIDQRFMSKMNKSLTINRLSEHDLTPLTSKLPDIHRTSAFGFLSPRRFTEHPVMLCSSSPDQNLRQICKPLPIRVPSKCTKIDEREAVFNQSTPNKLVEKWVSAPDEIEESDAVPKEFRLMKSRGTFFYI